MAIIESRLGWRNDDQEVISHWECSENSAQSDSRYGEAAIMRHIPGGSHPILRRSGEYAILWTLACGERRKYTWRREKLICSERNIPTTSPGKWHPNTWAYRPGSCPNSLPKAGNPLHLSVPTSVQTRNTYGFILSVWLRTWTVNYPVHKEGMRFFLWI